MIKPKKKIYSPKNKKANPSKNYNNLYLTDIGSPIGKSLNHRLLDILSNKNNKSKSKNTSYSRAQSSPSSDGRSIKNLGNKDKSIKSSQEKTRKKIKYIPFNSATLRDCGEKFILNDNPGVGMYNPSESPYFGMLYVY